MTQDAEMIDEQDDTASESVIEAEPNELPATTNNFSGMLPPRPGTALALDMPPTAHEMLSFAVQLERLAMRAENSDAPGMSKYGTVTCGVRQAASSLRSAIGHTL